MATAKLQKLPVKGKKGVAVQMKKSVGKLTLPSKLSVPPTEIGAYTMLIYGRKKIGKTSLVSNFPETFCLMFEPGGTSLKIYQRQITEWEEFLGYLELLESGDHNFKTVLIDTGKVMYDKCLEYVCRINGMEHPQDEEWGKGWEKVRKELEFSFARLTKLKLGVIVICHEKIKNIKAYDNTTYDRIEPNLSKQATDYFAAVIDTIAYYHYVNDVRILTIAGGDLIEAGTRCEYNFFTPKKERVVNIPMGSNSKEAYNNVITAFENKQTTTGKEGTVVKKKALKKALLKKT